MRTALYTTAAIALAVGAAMPASAEYVFDGREVMNGCRQAVQNNFTPPAWVCMGIIRGITVFCSMGMSSGQVAGVLARELEQHPEFWKYDGAIAAALVIDRQFDCAALKARLQQLGPQ
jgi:hypothetical protein